MSNDTALERRRQAILAACQRRGLSVIQTGNVWRVMGTGVDLMVSDLAILRQEDLERFSE